MNTCYFVVFLIFSFWEMNKYDFYCNNFYILFSMISDSHFVNFYYITLLYPYSFLILILHNFNNILLSKSIFYQKSKISANIYD